MAYATDVFFLVLEATESKTKVGPMDLVPGEVLFLACRPLSSCYVCRWWREKEALVSSSSRDTHPVVGSSRLHLNTGSTLRLHLQILSLWALGFLHVAVRGHELSVITKAERNLTLWTGKSIPLAPSLPLLSQPSSPADSAIRGFLESKPHTRAPAC